MQLFSRCVTKFPIRFIFIKTRVNFSNFSLLFKKVIISYFFLFFWRFFKCLPNIHFSKFYKFQKLKYVTLYQKFYKIKDLLFFLEFVYFFFFKHFFKLRVNKIVPAGNQIFLKYFFSKNTLIFFFWDLRTFGLKLFRAKAAHIFTRFKRNFLIKVVFFFNQNFFFPFNRFFFFFKFLNFFFFYHFFFNK